MLSLRTQTGTTHACKTIIFTHRAKFYDEWSKINFIKSIKLTLQTVCAEFSVLVYNQTFERLLRSAHRQTSCANPNWRVKWAFRKPPGCFLKRLLWSLEVIFSTATILQSSQHVFNSDGPTASHTTFTSTQTQSHLTLRERLDVTNLKGIFFHIRSEQMTWKALFCLCTRQKLWKTRRCAEKWILVHWLSHTWAEDVHLHYTKQIYKQHHFTKIIKSNRLGAEQDTGTEPV